MLALWKLAATLRAGEEPAKYGFAKRRRERGSRTPKREGTNSRYEPSPLFGEIGHGQGPQLFRWLLRE